jgi:hypothetical protein
MLIGDEYLFVKKKENTAMEKKDIELGQNRKKEISKLALSNKNERSPRTN